MPQLRHVRAVLHGRGLGSACVVLSRQLAGTCVGARRAEGLRQTRMRATCCARCCSTPDAAIRCASSRSGAAGRPRGLTDVALLSGCAGARIGSRVLRAAPPSGLGAGTTARRPAPRRRLGHQGTGRDRQSLAAALFAVAGPSCAAITWRSRPREGPGNGESLLAPPGVPRGHLLGGTRLLVGAGHPRRCKAGADVPSDSMPKVSMSLTGRAIPLTCRERCGRSASSTSARLERLGRRSPGRPRGGGPGVRPAQGRGGHQVAEEDPPRARRKTAVDELISLYAGPSHRLHDDNASRMTTPELLEALQKMPLADRVRLQALRRLARLGHLPESGRASARAWLDGSFFTVLLTEKLIVIAKRFPPRGIPLASRPAAPAAGVVPVHARQTRPAIEPRLGVRETLDE